MFLGGGRKPEFLERTHAYTGRTCKLHTERPQLEPSCCEAMVLTTTTTTVQPQQEVHSTQNCETQRRRTEFLPDASEEERGHFRGESWCFSVYKILKEYLRHHHKFLQSSIRHQRQKHLVSVQRVCYFILKNPLKFPCRCLFYITLWLCANKCTWNQKMLQLYVKQSFRAL